MDSYQRPKWPRAYAASPPEPIGRIDIWTYQLSQLVSQLSFLYELALTWLHSFAKWIFFDLLRIDELFRRTPRKVTHPWEEFVATHSTTVVDPTPSGASQRAWWDNSNGSAIVIYGGSSQDLVTSLAISLASCKSQSRRNEARAQASSRHRPERPTSSGNSEWLAWIRSTASQLLSRDHSYRGGGSARSGRAPFTVIVLVPRAEDLSQLIHAWASSKALLDRHRAPSPPESTIDGTQTPLSPKTPPTSLSPPSRSRPSSPTASSSNASGTFRSRSRALSWGQWAAHSGLVGFRDLWKGVRIGEESTRNEFGAVIPIVCDESSSEHSDHARDTVMSYCNSHDLLLRGLIVIPDKASDEHQLTLRHLSALLEHDRGRLITIETASHRTNPTPSFGQDISRSSVIIGESAIPPQLMSFISLRSFLLHQTNSKCHARASAPRSVRSGRVSRDVISSAPFSPLCVSGC